MLFYSLASVGIADARNDREVCADVAAKLTLNPVVPTLVTLFVAVSACTSPNTGATERVVSATARSASDATPGRLVATSTVQAPTVTVTVTPTPPAPPAAPSDDVVKTTPTKPTRKPVPEPKKAVQLAADSVFTTPSENIACGPINSSGLFCSIGRKVWKFPQDLLKPSDCPKPQAVALTSRVHAWCVDAGFSKQKIVPYGTVVQVNDFRCAVERRGVMCAGSKTQDRFSISESKLTFWPRPKQVSKPTS